MFRWKQGSFTTTSYYVCTQYTQELSIKGICYLHGPVMLQQLCGHLKTQLEGGKKFCRPKAWLYSPGSRFTATSQRLIVTCGAAGCRCRMQVWIIQRQQMLPSFFCRQNCLNSVRQTARGVCLRSHRVPLDDRFISWHLIGQTDICLVSRRLRGDINVHAHTVAR